MVTTLFMFFSFLTFSQKYPRIEKDSLGNKFVIMTYEQAQKIDNAFELVNLLEKAGAECDSLSLSYVKVISKLEKQVFQLENLELPISWDFDSKQPTGPLGCYE